MHDPTNPSRVHSDSVVDRFWANVHRRQDHQCWPRVGSRMVRGGYGQLNDRGRLLKSHRISWEIHFGRIKPGLVIRHLCHNPECCNPSHLMPGTHAENHLDMELAGRMKVPGSKVTAQQAIEIFKSEESGPALAKKYGVSNSTISCIRTGKTWKRLTGSL